VQAIAMREAGATIVGGCCGTTPAHLAAIVARLGTAHDGAGRAATR